jgi:hypothetical protein
MTHSADDEILFQFFGGHFGEDWIHDCTTWKCVCDALLQDWPSEEVDELVGRLQRDFAESELREEELIRKAEDLGFNYRLEVDGYTMRSWLKEAIEYLQRP